MKDNIRLLEERVGRAVEQLERLSAARDRLETENGELRARLEAPGRVPSVAGGEPARDNGTGNEWEMQRTEIAVRLREAIAELRGD